jgi:5-methylcytosine-specific restriction protein A
MRAQVLSEEPLCRLCQAKGLVTASTIADHIVPLSQGGSNDRGNFQGLCDPCSDAKTAAEAVAGAAAGSR